MKYSTELKIKNIVKKIIKTPGKIMGHLMAADHDGSGQWASPYEKSEKCEKKDKTKD